jgi:hypothetical protein
MATTTTTTPFVMRLIGALALDPVTYEEVEADRSATGQAILVVVLSSVGAGVGARGLGTGSARSMVFICTLSIMAWAAWALLTYQIGARLMPEALDYTSTARAVAVCGLGWVLALSIAVGLGLVFGPAVS